MAKAPKKAERKQKLKVFRTPIGFHDAYVAAPSQKAALEAWGADSNIFAQGIAEQVTELRKLDERMQALERELRELKRKHEKERDKLTDKRDGARATYDQAMRKWRDG
jgi:predicted  nucleic acid-binding Zn-ribbon protein